MFYDTFKAVCKSNKTSPSAVVQSLGMSKSNVTFWKSGRSPKLEVVLKIAKQLNVDPSVFVKES